MGFVSEHASSIHAGVKKFRAAHRRGSRAGCTVDQGRVQVYQGVSGPYPGESTSIGDRIC